MIYAAKHPARGIRHFAIRARPATRRLPPDGPRTASQGSTFWKASRRVNGVHQGVLQLDAVDYLA